jgi:hypothetical protein
MPAIPRDIGHLFLSCCNHSRLSTVDTGADTAATVIMGGRILTLDRNSSAVFRNETLVLSQGKAWLSDQNGGTPGTVTRLAAPRVTAPSTAPLAADETSGQGDNPSSNDHFTDTCKHRECVCTYKSDHDKDDISPIRPDSDDFQCQPVGDRCRNDDCGN